MSADSTAQQQAMGIAHAIQQGEMQGKEGMPGTKIAATMNPAEVKKIASTPHKGLPKHVKPKDYSHKVKRA